MLMMATSLAFAAPGIKITHPENNSTVNPGQQITITLEATEGFVINRGRLGTLNFFTDEIWSLPATFTVIIPQDAIGALSIMAIATGKGNITAQDNISLKIEQTATLQSLIVTPDKISIKKDWEGNIDYYERDVPWYIGVKGMYSDGVAREISNFGTTYTSIDPTVASVNAEGKITIHKVGETKILISNSGVSAEVPIIFEEPRGIRPQETKPPTTSIDIQPPSNQAGWHNETVTVTITAVDNEGGSGIQEIDYQWYNLRGGLEITQGDRAVLTLSEEGVNHLRYYAVDKERNEEQADHDIEFKLDKTPPVTTATITPQPNADGLITSLPVVVSFTATDNLSGVASTTPNATLTKNGEYKLEYYSTDVAGNVESSKTITVKIAVIDTVPPQITLGLQRLGFWSWFNFYRLIYSAVDDNSGVKEVKAGLSTPNIADFGFKLKESKKTAITIDEKKKMVIINAPQPQTISEQLKQNLLLIDNNQLLHLDRTKRQDNWKITQNGLFLFIKAPSIVFKAQATDKAGNSDSQELSY